MKKTLAMLLAVLMIVAVFAGCDNANDDDATYTYNISMSVFPKVWNPHTYEENTEGEILGYLSDGFYTFDYNEDETGFQMVPSMTTDDHPVDITSDYVGKWGIEEGDSKLVWKINLRDDLKWETGERITAHDYVESAKRLLNPKANNYRADTMYTGDVIIAGAEMYFKQGSVANASVGSVMDMEGFATIDEFLEVYGDTTAKINWYYSFGGPYNFDTEEWEDPKVNAVEATTLTMKDMIPFFVTNAMDLNGADEATANAWVLDELYIDYTYPDMSWDEVGLFALSDTELVYVITTPLDGFELKYSMPSGYLVHLKTYDECTSVDEDGNYTNTYMTSAETSVSYGTYNLTKFQMDKEIEFERSETWFGLKDGGYQTTHINIQFVDNDNTRLQLLKEGKLDTYGLTANDFETYGLSDNTYYSEGASTFAMTFNPNLDALKASQEAAGANINKTIITLIEFRMAMSFGMNRPAFTAATDPAGVNAYGLFTNQHIIDPEAGIGYRSTEEAKDVLVEFWGLADDIGEGKLYADKDAAIASLTGYNPEQAKQLFNDAYDKAIAEKLMDADDVIEIKIGLPTADSTFYNNGYNFIVNNYTELVKGTKLEGKLTFTRDDTLGNDFAAALQSNKVDMLFGVGWSGMELNPYGLIMAYVSPQYQYDAATDFTSIQMTATLGGKEYTASVYDWYLAINGAPITITAADGTKSEYVCGAADEKTEERLHILAQLEKAVLMNYNYIPLNGDAGAQLKGMQLKYYHEEYMFGMGFGGIKYMTYNYTDAEWDAYVASQGGVLDYT